MPDARLPRDVVRMGSRVVFRTGEEIREAELVYPAQADIAQGRISVLTPVGTALIGLRAGQSITWRTRDGRKQVLTIVRVTPPVVDSDDRGRRRREWCDVVVGPDFVVRRAHHEVLRAFVYPESPRRRPGSI